MARGSHISERMLRDLLADTFDLRWARLIVRNAGLRLASNDWNGADELVWLSIFETAIRAGTLDDLLTEVVRQCPKRGDIQQAIEAYLNYIRDEKQASSADPAPRATLTQADGAALDDAASGCNSPETSDTASVPGRTVELVVEIRVRFRDASQNLATWSVELPTGRWIDRPELKLLVEGIENGSQRFAALLGAPGAGKSALLAKLANQLVEQDVAVLAIKADRVPLEVRSLDDLAHEIGVQKPVLDCLRLLAAQGKVVVIVDQLDALADRVDLRSERLNVLLRLIDGACAIENVHVVASCRRFECEHDPRLARLRNKVVALELPPVSSVEAELRAAGISPGDIPPTVKEVLRAPQTLGVFLKLVREGATAAQLSTYHAMLEARWNAEVASAPDCHARQQLLYKLATRMADDEVLHLPRAHFSELRVQIDALVAAGWLVFDGRSNTRIAFAHQTLFDFVWARSYVGQAGDRRASLHDFVLAKDSAGMCRQDAIFVRPRVWNLLQYLRDADERAYLAEFRGLWEEPALRSHLRRLLIDFLGHASEPRTEEVVWMRVALQTPEYEIQAWRAMLREPSWFDALSGTDVLRAMTGETTVRNLVAWFLGSVVTPRRDQVLRLLEGRWLRSGAEDLSRAARVLSELTEWNAAAVNLAVDVATRAPFDSHTVFTMAKAAVRGEPAGAARILGAAIRAEADRLIQAMPQIPLAPTGDDAGAYYDWDRRQRAARQPLHDLLLDRQHWYGLGDLATATPEAFVVELLPVVRHIVEAIVSQSEREVRHRYPYALDLDLHREESVHRETIWGALRVAVERIAAQSPESWFKVLRELETSDVQDVHHLLLLGLAHLPAQHAGKMVEYLRRDPRRWVVGSLLSPLSETRHALEIVGKKLSDEQRARLAAMIHDWDPGIDVTDDVERESNAERPGDPWRATLLSAFIAPEETSLIELVGMDSQRVRDARASAARPLMEAGVVGSPISCEQMKDLDDDTLLAAAVELPDATEWRHPREWMQGGSIQFSRELELLAKDNPERALRLLRRLPVTSHQRQVAHVLTALTELPERRAEVATLAKEFDTAGCSSETFRGDVADALRKVANALKGLGDETVDLLAGWLTEAAPERADRPRERWTARVSSPQPILFGGGAGPILPHGNRPILDAITAGLLCREVPAHDRWLSILEQHLTRDEDPAVWEAVAWDLRFVGHVPVGRACTFLSTLFGRYPSVLTDLRGLLLLLTTFRWAPPRLTQTWMLSLFQSQEPWLWQAFGELLVIRCGILPDEAWTRERIESVLDAPERARDFAVRHGVAFASAYRWHDGREDTPQGRVLLRLASVDDAAISAAIRRAIAGDHVLPHPMLVELLRAVRDNPFHLAREVGPSLFQRMHEVLDGFPDLVADLCEQMVAKTGPAVGDIRLAAHQHAGDLVDLSIQLQRNPAQRARGLDLFEKLLSFQVYEAEKVLFENDGVPRSR